jgi:hypothetical protein
MEEKLIGFLLTTIAGGLLGFYLSRTKWKTETGHAIYRAFFDEGIKFLDELSELVGRRFFLLDRLLWVVAAGEPIQAKVTEEQILKQVSTPEDSTPEDSSAELARHLKKIGEAEQEYYEATRDWNARYWKHRNKIRLLVSEDQAKRFLDYQPYDHPLFNEEDPKSLHYWFLHSDRKVMRCTTFSSRDVLVDASTALVRLNWECSLFLEQLTTEFLARAADLKLLRVPKTPGGAELAKPAQKSG